jgi:hypothetical protein
MKTVTSKTTSQEAFEKFEKSWLEQISKIENRAIDSEGIYRIYLHFHKDSLYLSLKGGIDGDEFSGFYEELCTLKSKLVVALETARSKYRLENRSIWARIAESMIAETISLESRDYG